MYNFLIEILCEILQFIFNFPHCEFTLQTEITDNGIKRLVELYFIVLILFCPPEYWETEKETWSSEVRR